MSERARSRPVRDARAFAALRVAMAAVLAVSVHAAGNDVSLAFDVVAACTFGYALAVLGCVMRAGSRPPRAKRVVVAADLVLLVALASLSGDAFGTLRPLFAVFPLAAIFLARPREVLAWAAIAPVAYMAASIAPLHSGATALASVAAGGLGLALLSAFTVAVAHALARRDGEIQALAAGRRELVAKALNAEDRERRRISLALHDGAVQSIMVACQEVGAVRRGEDRPGPALARAEATLHRTVQELRAVILELHPPALDGCGLHSALRDVVAAQAQRAGFEAQLAVCPIAARLHDPLVYALAREFVVNAAKHAGASRVAVDVVVAHGRIALEVRDDGCGFAPDRLHEARAQGHVGLASAVERVSAVGGSFEIAATPRAGTTVRVELPVVPPAAHPIADRPAAAVAVRPAPAPA